MSERAGVAAAVLSSALGGTAAAMTRFVIGDTDPVTLAAFRFGIAFVVLAPIALALRSRWPRRRDLPGVAALGMLFFTVFFVVYNTSMSYTTAARGSLALSTLPLTTMLLAALLGLERLTLRKTAGVLVAIGGVAAALVTALPDAPAGAWRGDLIMAGGTVLMAIYNVASRSFVLRSSRLGFLTAGMSFGACASLLAAWHTGGLAATHGFGGAQWTTVFALGVLGGAAAFYLWVFALEHTTPTRVASTMTVNPIAASVLAAWLVGEPLGLHLLVGVLAVGAGVLIASSEPRRYASSARSRKSSRSWPQKM